MVQSDEYYKSRAVGVTSEVGLTPDRRPFRVVSLVLFLLLLLLPRTYETRHLLYFCDTGSYVVRATIQQLYKYQHQVHEIFNCKNIFYVKVKVKVIQSNIEECRNIKKAITLTKMSLSNV